MNNNFQSILISIIIGLAVAVTVMAFKAPTSFPPNSAGQVIYADSSGNVGIGTTTISTLFTVATSTNIFNVLSSGNVGVGTSTPAYKLDVYGTIRGSSVLNPTYAP